MSSPAFAVARANSTPIKQITTPGGAVKESPGNWKHPRLTEITRRQSKTIFSEKNIRQIAYNVAALFGVGVLREVVLPLVPAKLLTPTLKQYSSWISAALLLIPLINIAIALLPLARPRDDLADIPLTPAQRRLLGLPPSSRGATPNSVYSTPPRYSRTPSLAGSPVSIKSYATGSPLSSPTPYAFSRNSPSPAKQQQQYSPSGAVSPLLHKAVVGNGHAAAAAARASSFGSPSPLGASTASSVFGEGPATPTPAGGKRSSVGLNSKWLYEKGRRNSSSNWLHQNLS
ncbi:NPCC-domain-containing protein [Trichocladium antarcticum]|uniref:NPCC-domain-containing protein n=1 Tax=Trichocladium antarcticum TaxID=1450529 RepID=A0AAN6UR33_9PEZI|nr:NPCC-domain-containing protein [Trichocladium antarcticum]